MEDKSPSDNGCGATFMGQFWYFGDDSKVSLTWIQMLFNNCRIIKVSKVIDCQLVRQKDLDFQFSHGSCNTFMKPKPRVLLCFDEVDDKKCYT